MYKRTTNEFLKDSINAKDIDPNLWDRLIWQQAMDKALRRKNDIHVEKEQKRQ